MADVHAAVVIAAPVEAVFDCYAQYARHPEWQPELMRAEVTTPGEVRPGTRGVETRRLLGRELSAAYEITEHDPPRRSAFRVLEGPMRPCGVATFAPHDGGTRMTFELDLGARGALRVLAPLIARVLTRRTRGHLQRFKANAERAAGPEEVLTGGNMTAVVRVGDTVRRAAGPWTPTIHAFMRHLRASGFEMVPEPLGIDDRGREIISLLPGSPATYPLPCFAWSRTRR